MHKLPILAPDKHAATGLMGFGLTVYSSGKSAVTPHWFLTILFSTLVAVPWFRSFRFHFSLRTLLIVMTLVAVGLGVVVHALRT